MTADQQQSDDPEQDARKHLADELVQVLPSFSRWIGSIRNADTPFGRVTYRQVEILYIIRKRLLLSDRVSPSDLADFVAVQRSVITRVLATLEANGFIERRTDPQDGRSHFIEITSKGIAVSEYIEEIFTLEMKDGIDFLESREVTQLLEYMHVFRRLSFNLDIRRRERLHHENAFKSFDDEPL